MGFDIYGLNPKEESGSYFRANCWYWRPLWSYVISVTPDLTKEEVQAGSDNSGNRIDEYVAKKIGNNILAEEKSGNLEKYYQDRLDYLNNLPKETCYKCNGEQVENCIVCNGSGEKEHMDKSYPFSKELAVEFAKFCINSGGFEIY